MAARRVTLAFAALAALVSFVSPAQAVEFACWQVRVATSLYTPVDLERIAKERGIKVTAADRKKAAACFAPAKAAAPERGVEQRLARVAHNHKVAGSSPAPATKLTAAVIPLPPTPPLTRAPPQSEGPKQRFINTLPAKVAPEHQASPRPKETLSMSVAPQISHAVPLWIALFAAFGTLSFTWAVYKHGLVPVAQKLVAWKNTAAAQSRDVASSEFVALLHARVTTLEKQLRTLSTPQPAKAAPVSDSLHLADLSGPVPQTAAPVAASPVPGAVA